MKNVNNYELPTNTSYLEIENQTVTSNHTNLLRQHYQSANLRTYLKYKHRWKDSTIDKIWWLVNGNAMKKYSEGRRTQLQKYIHQKLPTNYRNNKYYPFKPDQCSACNNCKETQEHMFQCNKCDTRNDIKTKYLKELKSLLDNLRTNETTTRVILSYLGAWLDNKQPPEIEQIAPEASVYLTQAISEQTEIGWNHFLYGRRTETWGTLYNHDIASKEHGLYHPTAEKWGTAIIEKTWNFVLEVWDCRNKKEHGENGDTIDIRREKAIQEVMWLKDKTKNIKNCPHRSITIESLKKTPIANILMMIDQLTRIKKANDKRSKEQGQTNDTETNTGTNEKNSKQEDEWEEQLCTK
jgi:hypothetical protein